MGINHLRVPIEQQIPSQNPFSIGKQQNEAQDGSVISLALDLDLESLASMISRSISRPQQAKHPTKTNSTKKSP